MDDNENKTEMQETEVQGKGFFRSAFQSMAANARATHEMNKACINLTRVAAKNQFFGKGRFKAFASGDSVSQRIGERG